jgi:hypothetical protein
MAKAIAGKGGGLFTKNRKYCAECPNVYYRRLLRDGWSLEMNVGPGRVAACTVFTKPLAHGWILRKFAFADVNHPEGSGAYWDEHELEHPTRKALLSLPSWEWAERDGQALIWAEKGVLRRALVNPAGPAADETLYDFNPMRFESREAPYSAAASTRLNQSRAASRDSNTRK